MSDATTPTLDLAKPRTIALSDGGKIFTFKCQRITEADWKAFYAAITIRASNSSEGRSTEMDFDSPYLVLVDRVLVYAEGYSVRGGGTLIELVGWKQKVPLRHRLALGRVLSGARASEQGDDFSILAEGEEVFIDAAWTADDNGKLRRFTGLRHLLATPSEKQFKRFSSENSRSLVVGGSRSGVTIYPILSVLFASLYDELVISVDESYVVDGQPLTTREQIVKEMDFSHKVMAAQQLFQAQQTVAPVEETAAE